MRLNTKTTKNITSNTKREAVIAMALVAGATMVLTFFVTIPVQEVHAQGPPAKAQAILAAEPSQRGDVASGGQGGGGGLCGHMCGE
ncbi:MAG: hypothetical protein M3247_01365 [Thermoproteota archaeon]|nr:hypothetical protein [Thermoproteota archaeon]